MFYHYAYVNPFSQNKEAAIAYLEEITRHPHEAISMPVFLQKDIESYTSKYDINAAVFTDIYTIFAEGAEVYTELYPDDGKGYNRHYDDYQKGLKTLEESIAAYQREIEMALNE